MVRVALLSDTHGTLDPRIGEAVRGCDLAVHAGDIGNAGVLAVLSPRSGRAIAVTGNNDTAAKWPTGDAKTLESLPTVASLELPGGRLVVIHGDRINPAARRHERLRRRFPDARLVVYGHSHRLVCDLGTLPWVVNPGAAGRSRTFGGPSMLILSATPDSWVVHALRFPGP